MAVLEPRNFLQPLLLLLLREQSDHGYELASRLRPMHDGEGDAGGVYRALRGLERQGLVCSEWQVSDVGPARRTYHVTADGLTCLEEQVRGLEHVHEVLHVFLDRYTRVVAADGRNGVDTADSMDRPVRVPAAGGPTGYAHGRARGNGVARPAHHVDGRTGR